MRCGTVALLFAALIPFFDISNGQKDWPYALEYDIGYDDPKLYPERIAQEKRGSSDYNDEIIEKQNMQENPVSKIETEQQFQQRQVFDEAPASPQSVQQQQPDQLLQAKNARKTTFSLKGIPSIVSPELLQALAAAGWQDEILIVDNDYPTLLLDEQTKIIRTVGVPMMDLVGEILNLWKLSDEKPYVVMTDGSGITHTLEDIVREIVQKEDKCGSPHVLDRGEYLTRTKFLQQAAAIRLVVQTSEPGPLNNIILRKGMITKDCLPSYASNQQSTSSMDAMDSQGMDMREKVPTGPLEDTQQPLPDQESIMTGRAVVEDGANLGEEKVQESREEVNENEEASDSKVKDHHKFKDANHKHNLSSKKNATIDMSDYIPALALQMDGKVSNGEDLPDSKVFINVTTAHKKTEKDSSSESKSKELVKDQDVSSSQVAEDEAEMKIINENQDQEQKQEQEHEQEQEQKQVLAQEQEQELDQEQDEKEKQEEEKEQEQKEQEQNEEQGLSDMKPAVAGGEMQNSFLEMEPEMRENGQNYMVQDYDAQLPVDRQQAMYRGDSNEMLGLEPLAYDNVPMTNIPRKTKTKSKSKKH